MRKHPPNTPCRAEKKLHFQLIYEPLEMTNHIEYDGIVMNRYETEYCSELCSFSLMRPFPRLKLICANINTQEKQNVE